MLGAWLNWRTNFDIFEKEKETTLMESDFGRTVVQAHPLFDLLLPIGSFKKLEEILGHWGKTTSLKLQV